MLSFDMLMLHDQILARDNEWFDKLYGVRP